MKIAFDVADSLPLRLRGVVSTAARAEGEDFEAEAAREPRALGALLPGAGEAAGLRLRAPGSSLPERPDEGRGLTP